MYANVGNGKRGRKPPTLVSVDGFAPAPRVRRTRGACSTGCGARMSSTQGVKRRLSAVATLVPPDGTRFPVSQLGRGVSPLPSWASQPNRRWRLQPPTPYDTGMFSWNTPSAPVGASQGQFPD